MGSHQEHRHGLRLRAGKMEQHAAGKPAVQESLCRGCHRCAKECGSDAITYNQQNKAVIDYDKCKGCGRCIGACSFDAVYSPTNAPTRSWTGRWPSTPLRSAMAAPASMWHWCRTSAPTVTATWRTTPPSCRISGCLPPLTRWPWTRPAPTPAWQQPPAQQPARRQPGKARLELLPRQLQGLEPQHRVEGHPGPGRKGGHGHPAVCAEKGVNAKTTKALTARGQRLCKCRG